MKRNVKIIIPIILVAIIAAGSILTAKVPGTKSHASGKNAEQSNQVKLHGRQAEDSGNSNMHFYRFR